MEAELVPLYANRHIFGLLLFFSFLKIQINTFFSKYETKYQVDVLMVKKPKVYFSAFQTFSLQVRLSAWQQGTLVWP